MITGHELPDQPKLKAAMILKKEWDDTGNKPAGYDQALQDVQDENVALGLATDPEA